MHDDPAYLVDALGVLVVRSKSQHVLEVLECFVHVILVVQTQSSHVHCVRIHPIKPEQVTAKKSAVYCNC